MLFNTHINAADWRSKELVALTGEYNSNKRLTLAEHQSVVGLITELAIDLTGKTDQSELKLNPRLKFNRYSGEDGYDSDDQYLYTKYKYITQYSLFNINVDYIRDSPLTSEHQDTELVLTNTRRETLNSNPTWENQFTESLTFFTGIGYSDVQYDEEENSPYVDYVYSNAFVGLSNKIMIDTDVGLNAFGSRYEAEAVENETDDYGLQLSVASDFSETFSASIRYSWNKTTVKIGPDGSFFRTTKEGNLLDLDILKQFENSEIIFSVENELRPSGTGLLERQERYIFSFSHRIASRVNGFLSIRNTFIDDATGSAALVPSEYRGAFFQLRYRMFLSWYLSGSCQYAWKKFENKESAAESNAFILTVSYQSK